MKPLHLNEDSTDETKRDMVGFVNAHFPEDAEPVMSIREILDNSDVVFGLWQIPRSPMAWGCTSSRART